MKSVTMLVAVIAVGLLMPNAIYAVGDAAEAKALLGPAFNLPGFPKSTDPRDSVVDAKLKELLEKRKLSDAETKWIGIVETKRKALDQTKTAQSLVELREKQIDNKRKAISKAVEIAATSMNAPINPLDQNDLKSEEENCPSDATQINAFSSLMLNKGLEEFKKNAPRFFQSSKEDKAKIVSDGLATAKRFKDELLAQQDERRKAASEEGNKRNIKEGLFSAKERVEGLKARSTELEDEDLKRQMEVIDAVFTKLMPKLEKENLETRDVIALGIAVKKPTNEARSGTNIAASQVVKNSKKVCQKNKEKLGLNPLEKGTLVNQAYESIIAKHDGDADFYANRTFWTMATNELGSLKCKDTSDEIEAAIGDASPLAQEIEKLGSQIKAEELVQNVANLLPQLQAALSGIGKPVKKALNYCAKSEVKRRNFEKYVAQNQDAGGAEAQARLGGRRARNGAGSRNSRPGSNNASAGGSAGAGRNSKNHTPGQQPL